MADSSMIGKEIGGPVELVVERGKIREFARATMSRNPAYLDDPEAVSAPTFLTTVNFWAPPGETPVGELGIDLKRLLHGGQRYPFYGPPPTAGTKLVARSRVEDVYEKEGKRGGTMTFIVLVQEFRDEREELRAEARSTLILTGQTPEGS
jgi:N-terminal half of MaoC dehydratase